MPNILLVVFWMTGALLSFMVAAVSIRGLAAAMSIPEILAIRTGFGMVVMIALALAIPRLRAHLKPRRMGTHVWRNAIHLVGQYFWSLGVTLLPLTMVFALEFTMPMWVALLAVFLLGEKMTPSRVGSIALGFLGVLVIVRPGMEGFQPAAFVVLVAALCYALSIIATKQLVSDVSAFAIIFWMNIMQFPMALAASDPLFFLRIDSTNWLAALGIGIAGLTSHYCLTKAFNYGDASIVVPIDFMRIPLIAIVGWLLYDEGLDVFVFAGAALIVVGVLWNLRAEMKRPPLTTATPAAADQVPPRRA